tara:strand:- start:168 stop:317 length:150 start_codon:yes stop_codon:yes gene_type:complete
MSLEDRIYILKMKIIAFRNKYKHIFEVKTEIDEAIFVFDKKDPHFVRSV